MKKIVLLALTLSFGLIVGTSFAAPLGVFDNWKMIADDDGVGYNGYVDPGWGGQDFDAEYLFYKLNGSTLSIGLQTGFDVQDGVLTHSSRDYYAGDLALSFDGDSSSYEYAFDFGLLAMGYNGSNLGTDAAGLYSVTSWNNDVYFTASNPFAMSAGTLLDVSSTTSAGYDSVADSYYRLVSFDLAKIEGLSFSGLDVHWTMSCGNDAIDGSAPVPEPATLILLGSGLAGLAFYRRKKK